MYLNEFDEAIALVDQLVKDFPQLESPRLDAVQAISYFKTNRTNEARRIIGNLRKKSESHAAGSPSFYLAMIYSQMEEIDSAFEALEKSFSDHEVEMYMLKVEPPFEPIRNDPRFKDLLDKVGFSNLRFSFFTLLFLPSPHSSTLPIILFSPRSFTEFHGVEHC
jgi:hypothetical protein